MEQTTAKTPEENQKEMFEQMQKWKGVLYNQFVQQCQMFNRLINEIPFQPYHKQIIIKHLDDCYVWGKEGFLFVNLVQPNQPQLEVVESTDKTENNA